nr:hypothetical protein [Rhodococcus wratislaviensis]
MQGLRDWVSTDDRKARDAGADGVRRLSMPIYVAGVDGGVVIG